MSRLTTCTQDTRPTNPREGDLLYETDTGRMIIFYDNDWIAYGRTTVTQAEAAKITLVYNEERLYEYRFSSGQTGDIYLDTTIGFNELGVITNTTNIMYKFMNLNSYKKLQFYDYLQAESVQHSELDAGHQLDTTVTEQDLFTAGDMVTSPDQPGQFFTTTKYADTTRLHKFVNTEALMKSNLQPKVETVTSNTGFDVSELLLNQLGTIDSQLTRNSVIVNSDGAGIYNSFDGNVWGDARRSSPSKSLNLKRNGNTEEFFQHKSIYGTGLIERFCGNNSLEGKREFSIDIWFKFYDSPLSDENSPEMMYMLFGYSNQGVWIGKHEHTPDTSNVYTAGATGWRLFTGLHDESNYFGRYNGPSNQLVPDQWYRFTLSRKDTHNPTGEETYNRTGSTIKMYLDGQLINTETYNTAEEVDTNFSSGVIYIREIAGAYRTKKTQDIHSWFNGLIHGIAVYNRELTQQEVTDTTNPINWMSADPYGMYHADLDRSDSMIVQVPATQLAVDGKTTTQFISVYVTADGNYPPIVVNTATERRDLLQDFYVSDAPTF